MSRPTVMATPPARHAPPSEADQRIVLHGVSWATYDRLLADFANRHTAHFTYDRGTLEIRVLSFKHERFNRIIASLFETLAVEMSIDFENAGSTTFKREDLAHGLEPDSCFYIQQAARIRGKEEIDLTADPPPDFVVEIDISHGSLDKFPIYAAAGVPEIWRYDGTRLAIFRRTDGPYGEYEESAVLPRVTSQALSGFIEQSKSLARAVWLQQVRKWARKHVVKGDASR